MERTIEDTLQNHIDAWNYIFDKINVGDENKALLSGTIVRYEDTLQDPEFPVVGVILWMYAAENFIQREILRATKERDASKIETIGPLALALFRIMEATTFSREENSIQQYNFQLDLFRACYLSSTLIEKFRNVENPEGLGNVIKFEGYTSTSLDREIALHFLDNKNKT